jgi:hypothetical protein
MPFKDPEKRREYERSRSYLRKTDARRDYERERRNRKRVEYYESLPEPIRTQKLERNAARRAYEIRWRVQKEDSY